jgi:hypothetical protein
VRKKREETAPMARRPSRKVLTSCDRRRRRGWVRRAEKLRREQYQGSIVLLSDDDTAVDRPNLPRTISPAVRRRIGSHFARRASIRENGIDLRLSAVTDIDAIARVAADGRTC